MKCIFSVKQVTVNVSGDQLNNFVNPTYHEDQNVGIVNVSSVSSAPVQVKSFSPQESSKLYWE